MALDPIQPWHYFDPAVEATALADLRARMGASFASSPDDATLKRLLARVVKFLHSRTGQFFLIRSGDLRVNGLGGDHLPLPYPVVSTDQGGAGVTSILVDGFDTAIDSQAYRVNDGAIDGPEDPRLYPFVERAPYQSGAIIYGPLWSSGALFPKGSRNILITADWGYVEEDGSTPEEILYFIARACVVMAPTPDDYDGQEDKRRGAIVMEQTRGRMVQMAQESVSRGILLDRELDEILAHYTRPAPVVIGATY